MTHVHLIGIGGTGLSAIARLLVEKGYTVTGSDLQLTPLAQNLQEAGVSVFIGHRMENIVNPDLVIRSSAVPDDNVEVRAAIARGIPVLKRADFLGQLMEGRLGIAVAGSHGKTTTTAMIAWVLSSLGKDPSFIIGGLSRNLGTNAHAGAGDTFVIEADEYDGMFFGLRPKIAVVTNVDHDHPDFYPTSEDYYRAFVRFVSQILPGGTLITNREDLGAERLSIEVKATGLNVLTYGILNRPDLVSMEYDFSARQLRTNPQGGFSFEVVCADRTSHTVSIQIPGVHNVRNALAVISVIYQLGLSLEDACRFLEEFRGTGRRFEVRGEAGGVTVIDDYAHHPTELKTTIAAALSRYPGRRLWVVWQPHTYSRIRAFYNDFISSFSDADHVIVTEVYASREAGETGFTSRQLVETMSHPDARYAPDLPHAVADLLQHLRRGDVLLVLSAGDADWISTQVLAALHKIDNETENIGDQPLRGERSPHDV
jgi:UDP-N-acetylmuramate--alanine ligase